MSKGMNLNWYKPSMMQKADRSLRPWLGHLPVATGQVQVENYRACPRESRMLMHGRGLLSLQVTAFSFLSSMQ